MAGRGIRAGGEESGLAGKGEPEAFEADQHDDREVAVSLEQVADHGCPDRVGSGSRGTAGMMGGKRHTMGKLTAD